MSFDVGIEGPERPAPAPNGDAKMEAAYPTPQDSGPIAGLAATMLALVMMLIL